MKILICCGSQQRDKLKEKQNPIPVEDLGETNYTSAGSPGKSRKCSAPKMLLQEPFFFKVKSWKTKVESIEKTPFCSLFLFKELLQKERATARLVSSKSNITLGYRLTVAEYV